MTTPAAAGASEDLNKEITSGRRLATATLTRKLVFSLPRALKRHPGVEVPARAGTKEVLVWGVVEGNPRKVYVVRSTVTEKAEAEPTASP